ncbi:MAG: hypothetical protein KDA88_06165 [Planctomycetaceae bacterium]|nr:hypothetical protein [Planctomycetaceae bacterium]MCB9951461.1 hypothetical protein [Planctomycetaceae bacterium]
MTIPRLPGGRPKQPRPKSYAGFWAGMSAVVLTIGGLTAVVTAIMPDAIFLFLVAFGFAGMVGLHYLTWGWWLSKSLQESDPADADEPAWPEPPAPPEY